jgi:hypothetical protein
MTATRTRRLALAAAGALALVAAPAAFASQVSVEGPSTRLQALESAQPAAVSCPVSHPYLAAADHSRYGAVVPLGAELVQTYGEGSSVHARITAVTALAFPDEHPDSAASRRAAGQTGQLRGTPTGTWAGPLDTDGRVASVTNWSLHPAGYRIRIHCTDDISASYTVDQNGSGWAGDYTRRPVGVFTALGVR